MTSFRKTHQICGTALALGLLVIATAGAHAAPIQFGITDLGRFTGFGLADDGHVIDQPERNIVGELGPASHPIDYPGSLIQVVDGAADGKLLVAAYGTGSMSHLLPRSYVYDPHPASGNGGPDYVTLAGDVGQKWTAGKDMNARGDVIGAAAWGGVEGVRPFYAASDSLWRLQDLNDLIPANSGWKLNDVYSINDRGQILGTGVNPEGQSSSFLLTPAEQVPEPAAWAVFGLAAAAFAWRKRRAA